MVIDAVFSRLKTAIGVLNVALAGVVIWKFVNFRFAELELMAVYLASWLVYGMLAILTAKPDTELADPSATEQPLDQ